MNILKIGSIIGLFGVIFLGIRIFSSDSGSELASNMGSGDTIRSENTNSWEVGNTLIIQGTIQKNSQNSITHPYLLVTSDNIKYGLQSSTHNFSDYGGKVEIQGTIIAIEKILPIVQVSNIKVIQSDTVSFDLKKPFSFLIVDKGLYVNFPDESYTLQQTQSGIEIKNTAQKALLSIEIFECQLSVADRNCKKLLQSYSQSGFETFSSSNGDMYYRMPGQNIWFTSSDQRRGYRITAQDEKTMVALSQSIQYLNKDFFLTLLGPESARICFDRTDSMQTLDKIDLKYQDKKFTARLIGKDLNQTLVTCNISITESSKGFDVRMMSFQGPEPLQEPIVVAQNTDMNNAMVYQARGYQVVFPSKDILFQIFLSKEDFGVLGLSCPRKINIIDSKYKKLSDENPQYIKFNPVIEIFICDSQSTQGFEDMTKDTLLYKFFNNQHFFIRVNDSSWKSFARNIVIQ